MNTKRFVIGLLTLAVMLSSCGGSITEEATPTPQAMPASLPMPQVSVKGEMAPAVWATLSAQTSGMILEVLVAEGDLVKANQVLLQLDSARQAAAVAQAEAQLSRARSTVAELQAGARPEEIESTQAAVEAAQAQLARVQQGARVEEIAAAEAVLAGAQASLQKVKEGPDEGTLVAARADLANAEAALKQAQAAYDQVKGQPNIQMRPEALALEQATHTYEAAQGQLAALQKGATAADIAAARAQVQQAQAQLDALKAPARVADVAAAEAEIRRAQAQLALLEAGARPETIAAAEAEVAAAEAALEQSRIALADTELRAPFAGTVSAVHARMGESVAPGQPLITLGDLTTLRVETTNLDDVDVALVKLDQAATVTFNALPGRTFAGRVTHISPMAEPDLAGGDNYTVIVALDVDELAPEIRWGMDAFVTLEVE
jgi:HlyD family secretion protein